MKWTVFFVLFLTSVLHKALTNVETQDDEPNKSDTLLTDKLISSRNENSVNIKQMNDRDQPGAFNNSPRESGIVCDNSSLESQLGNATNCQSKGNDQTTTTETQVPYFSMNAPDGSCDNYCSKNEPTTCQCHPNCILYKTCCKDVESVCPHPELDHRTRLQHMSVGFMTTIPTCDKVSGTWLYDYCPNRGDQYLESEVELCNQNDTICRIINRLRKEAYVTDVSSGVLFKNFSIYKCFVKSDTEYHIWRPTFPVEYIESIESTKHLLNLIENDWTNMGFRPSNFLINVYSCLSLTETDRPSYLLIDYESEKYFEISLHGSRIALMSWKSLKCPKDNEGMCSLQSCNADAVFVNGNCEFHSYIRLIVSHPEKPLTLSEIEEFAIFIRCTLMNHAGVYEANYSVTTNFVFLRKEFATNKDSKYFRIMMFFASTVHPAPMNLYHVILELIPAYFEDKRLVSGLFLRWLNKEMAENSKRNTTETGYNDKVHGALDIRYRPIPTTFYDPFHFAWFEHVLSTPKRVPACQNSVEKKGIITYWVLPLILLMKEI